MTCREMTEFLSDYVAGELQPQVLVEFESHVSECGDCVTFISQYRTTIRAGATAFHEPAGPLPEALVAAILAACEKDVKGRQT